MTAEQYIDAVRLLSCCICGFKPVSAHHVVGGSVVDRLGERGSRRHSDWLTLPLCHHHHQGADGIHQGERSWEVRHGTQVYWVTATGKRLDVDPWAQAAAERGPSKIMARRFA